MEHKINDMVGGKPYKECDTIDEDRKPKYHKKDIEEYQGQWCMMFFGKNGDVHSSIYPLVYDTDILAQSDIDYVFKDQCDLSGKGKIVKFEDLSHGFPMPVKKGTA